MVVSKRRHGAPGVGTLLANAIAMRRSQRIAQQSKFRGYGSRTGTGVKRERFAGTNTTQRDVTTRYVRHRMPAWRRRKWVGFVNRVRHVELQSQPLQTYQALLKGSVTTALGEQYSNGVFLKDVNMPNQGDLVNIFKDAYGGLGGIGDYDNRRIYMKAAVLDFQIKNIGSEQCVIDVYQIQARKGAGSTAFTSLNDIWVNGFNDMASVGVVSPQNPAMTPFDNPSFCKYFLIKSKREYIISPDQLITMQLRDPRNRYIQGRLMQFYNGFMPGTEGFFFQVRGTPEDTLSSSGLTTAAVAWSAQTTYHYAIPPGNTSETIGQSK